MKLWFSACLFMCLVLQNSHAAVAKKKTTSTASKEKLKDTDRSAAKIKSLVTKMAASPVVSLTDSTFGKFVIERPREYTAFLMFTATAKQYQCSVCVRAKTVLEEVAQYYMEQYDFNSTAVANRIAFFRIEVDDARATFNDMQLETVPRLYLLPPTTSDSPKMKMSDYEVESKFLMESASATLGEIHARSGIKVDIMVGPEPLLLCLGALGVLVALFVSAAASGDVYESLLWYQSPRIWVCVSMVCFGVGVSGSIFCIIRSAQPYGMTRTGMVLFAPQGRDQFLLEGVVVALWTVGCGLSYSLMLWATRLRFPVLRHVLVLLSMTLFIVLALQIWQAYIDKTSWYSLRETVPAELWAWLSASVKKTSGLPKRLLRVSEFWLFESKDWPTFVKKFNTLVTEYVRREFLRLTASGGAK